MKNLIFGGDLSSYLNPDGTRYELVPSDIEIRNNYFYKPLSWKIGHPSFAGYAWVVKNLFELKNAQRVVIDGNIFENNWRMGQVGDAILFTPRTENGLMPWARVQDVQFTNNIVRHTASAFQISGRDDNQQTVIDNRITIRNNLFEDVASVTWCGSDCTAGNFLRIDATSNVRVDHNTFFHDGSIAAPGNRPNTGFVYTNNLSQRGSNGVFATEGEGVNALEIRFPGSTFLKNVVYGIPQPQSYYCGRPDRIQCYPAANNFYPPINGETFDSLFVNRAAGNYRLAANSPYAGAGTDGRDIGADIGAIEAATAGVITGISSQTAYTGIPSAVPGVIEAENYDNGGQGIAYYDESG